MTVDWIDWTSAADIAERFASIAVSCGIIWISPLRPKRLRYQLVVAAIIVFLILHGGIPGDHPGRHVMDPWEGN